MKAALLICIFLCSNLSVAGVEAPSSDLSLYQLDIQLTDQSGEKVSLDVFHNQAVLIGMFYANCPHVCPLTINNLQKTEAALDASMRKNLRVLLVSLDPEKDTPELLAEVANRHKIDLNRWKLARASQADVRKLAAVLGVRYRKLPDGEFNHSTLITLLDRKGIAITNSDQLSKVDEKLLSAVKAELASANSE